MGKLSCLGTLAQVSFSQKVWLVSIIESHFFKIFLRNVECRRLASASKDCTVKVWDTILSKTILTLSGHTQSVTCIRWGGTGLIYSSSQDRTVKVWRDTDASGNTIVIIFLS